MSLGILKKVRIATSIVFFLLTTLVLLDFRNVLSSAPIRSILFLQFTPSLINSFTFAGIASAGFLVILVMTLLFGRVYCSTVCPLGTLQDVFSYLSHKVRKKKYHEPLAAYPRIHFAFLVLTVLPLMAGSLIAVSLLDPFSNFGRIIGSLARPLIIVANNALASFLGLFKIYDVYAVEVKGVSAVSVILPGLFVALVAWMSIQHGRLYCNSICPVGSLLRLVSRFSFLKVTIDAKHCKGCQLCQRVCKSGCIDRKDKSIDFSRCVDCFNCLTACPSNGVKISSARNTVQAQPAVLDPHRRTFLFVSSLFLIGSGARPDTSKTVIPKKDSVIPERKNHAVSPPGSLSIKQFKHACTACHVCVSACPSKVLQPSILDYGLEGLLQPRMDFNAGYCNFECTICGEVCPSGALRKLTIEEKKMHQAGQVIFVKENCVVYTENTDCGACTEHCPTKAVTMVPYKNSRLPEIKPEYCIGCGACEHACPTRPYRAIYVDGTAVHGTAKKKEPEKMKALKLENDFPF